MTSAAERTAQETGAASARFAASVFGIHWRSSLPLIGFEADGAVAEGHALVLEASPREVRSGWESAETIYRQDSVEGRPIFVVERASDAYRIRAPRHGVSVIAGDGRTVWCSPPLGDDWRWQRPLYAQALPLAAELQGLHLLHASAVCIGDAAVALIAPSGTGKSTLAANLVARGHDFLTDDLLAVSRSTLELTAHAGPRLLALAADDYACLPDESRPLLGARVGHLDKLYLAPPVGRRSAPLRLLYFLERGDASGLEIREEDPPRPAALLGEAVLPYLQTKRRLVAHLDFCAALAERTRVFKARMPSPSASERLVPALEAHILEATSA